MSRFTLTVETRLPLTPGCIIDVDMSKIKVLEFYSGSKPASLTDKPKGTLLGKATLEMSYHFYVGPMLAKGMCTCFRIVGANDETLFYGTVGVAKFYDVCLRDIQFDKGGTIIANPLIFKEYYESIDR